MYGIARVQDKATSIARHLRCTPAHACLHAGRVQHNAHLRAKRAGRQVAAELGTDGAVRAVGTHDLAPLDAEARAILRHLALKLRERKEIKATERVIG